jgi:hypothetical protein
LAGVIGSDVLSRFGSVRIDYQNQTMSLGTTESESPMANGVVRGPTSRTTPAQFAKGIRAEDELTVVAQQGGVVAYAPIKFDGSRPQLLVVDTGAAISSISTPLARSLHLVSADRNVEFPAFGCPAMLAEVASGPWMLGATSVPPQLLATLPVSGLRVSGLFGSDVMSSFGVVVIDYRAARLLLESGA